MGLNKYIFTNEEFKNLKYVGSNPDIVSTSGLTEMVNENTLDISNLKSDNEINKDNITSLSALTLTKVLDDRTVGCITIPTLTDNNNGTATITSTTVF